MKNPSKKTTLYLHYASHHRLAVGTFPHMHHGHDRQYAVFVRVICFGGDTFQRNTPPQDPPPGMLHRGSCAAHMQSISYINIISFANF